MRPPFCALCTDYLVRPANEPGWQPRREPLGKGGAMVHVCEPCATQRVPERDHLFGGNRGGTGDGNRQVGRGASARRGGR